MFIHKATLIETETFKKAAILASVSNYANRVGCLIVKPNKILAGTVTRLENPANNVSVHEAEYHAEMLTIQAVKPTEKMVLYIARLNADWTVLDSRPCIRCMRAIKRTPIQQMVYQDTHGFLVREVI